MDLHGRRVIVTGATGGLGPSLVTAFLACGARVIAAARLRTGLDELRASLGHPDRLDVAECDVTSAPGVEALFEAAAAGDGLDAVVHAVGAFVFGPLADLSDADVERLVRTNVLGAAFVVRGALRRMVPRGRGRIVLMAADRALRPAPSFALYGAAKAAVVHLAEAAAEEGHESGVRVNVLLPGVIDTPANRAAMPDTDPLHWVRPEDIAKVAVWLCSSESHAVDGALIRLP